MKGIELPINVLIIVAVALVVLLAIIAIYFSGFNPFSASINLAGVKNEACREYVQERNCKGSTNDVQVKEFDADKDGTLDAGTTWSFTNAAYNCLVGGSGTDNLAALCKCYFNTDTEAECRKICGCP